VNMALSNYISYVSEDFKEAELACEYANKTKDLPHRYLAYRDLSKILFKIKKGGKALDFGCGTGISTNFLKSYGFDVIGVDISEEMLKVASTNYPTIEFNKLDQEKALSSKSKSYDLVFSSFVLFEINSKEKIVNYLKSAKKVLKSDGTFLSVTASEDMYQERNWMIFDTNYKENQTLKSGEVAKVLLNGADIEFTDYYWTEKDYRECFEKAGMKLTEIIYPLGKFSEIFPWKAERKKSPFVIFVAKPN
jgi:ubiquinone/menaquinone biosynthesis C-methylase UbiE